MSTIRKIQPPFQIDHDTVERSSTLTKHDIGKFALLISGCYQLFTSYDNANKCREVLNND